MRATAPITIRHLLTHSSGISYPDGDKDIVNPDVSEDALETHIRELADYSLARPVGESYEYSNLNYDILGLIVQTVSAGSFEDYIEEHIYSPLEMTNSYTSKSEADANGLAAGHTYFFGSPRVSADAPYPRRKLPSGFLISSAKDLGHYLIAQLNGGRYGETQVLSPETVALMHQPAVAKSVEGVSYAFGWNTRLIEGEPSVWHEGNSSNFHCNMAFSPTRGWGVAIVMNTTGFSQLAALNEPINQVFRLSSGYDVGQPIEDPAPVLNIIGAVVVLMAGLNLTIGSVLHWRRWRKGDRLRLVRHLVLPLAIDLLLAWIILSLPVSLITQAAPSIRASAANLPGLLEFLPDTTLIIVVSGGVVILTMLARVVVYLRFARRAGSGA